MLGYTTEMNNIRLFGHTSFGIKSEGTVEAYRNCFDSHGNILVPKNHTLRIETRRDTDEEIFEREVERRVAERIKNARIVL